MKTNPVFKAVEESAKFPNYDNFAQLEQWWKQAIYSSKGPHRRPDGGIQIEPHEVALLMMYAGNLGIINSTDLEEVKRVCAEASSTLRERGRTSPVMAKIHEAFKSAPVANGEEVF